MDKPKKLYVVLEGDKPVIREYQLGTRPSNFLSMCPRGLGLGDDNLLTWNSKTRHLEIHWERQVKVQKKTKARERKSRNALAWNGMSIKERLLKSFLKT